MEADTPTRPHPLVAFREAEGSVDVSEPAVTIMKLLDTTRKDSLVACCLRSDGTVLDAEVYSDREGFAAAE